jgi:hypothetical protein
MKARLHVYHDRVGQVAYVWYRRRLHTVPGDQLAALLTRLTERTAKR